MTDWDGQQYARFADLQHALGATFAAELPLEGSESVLDVGCGDGEVTALIAARLPTGAVTGIDPSPLMVAQAAGRAGANVHFEAGDVLALDLGDRTFDLVVSLNALHWVPDLGRAFAELRSVTAPAGRSVLQFVGASERRSLEQTAMDVAGSPRWNEYFDGFDAPFIHPSPGEVERLAAAAALRTAESHLSDHRFDFADRASFERWCALGFGSWLERVPHGDGAAFVADVVDRYTVESGSASLFIFSQLRVELTPA